uniref:Uncharacterized protein n=1 Tax=Anguilla anguilla TaxID=7936 RepID=A0A0E9RI35_ANGAN
MFMYRTCNRNPVTFFIVFSADLFMFYRFFFLVPCLSVSPPSADWPSPLFPDLLRFHALDTQSSAPGEYSRTVSAD